MIFVDMHCDTLTALMSGRGCGDLMENRLSVDFRRLQKNGQSIEFFACFVNLADFLKIRENADAALLDEPAYDLDRAWAYTCQVLDYFDENQRRYPGVCTLIKTAQDVEQFRKPVGALLTVEESGMLDGSLKRLEQLFDRGVRLMTLTWNYDNALGHPNHRDKVKNSLGLTSFGFEVIERMEELGMIVDVSHLSDGGFYDVARVMKKPFVASHSNARTLCGHQRNLTDPMIKALAQHGGVAGLNFCPAFLDEKNGSTVDAMIAHIRHMIHVGGEDVVALGTDFDGIGGPLEIAHTGEMLKLRDGLEKSGFTGRVIDKLWSQNAVRVMKEVLPQG